MTFEVSDPAADARRRRALGWGLACEPLDPGGDTGRDLVLRRRGDGLRDLAVVAGPDNLAQGLTLALTTALGGDPFDVGFGFDGVRAVAEETDPLLLRERVRVTVAQTLRRDPRVRRIVQVTLTPGAGGAAGVGAAGAAQDRRVLGVDVVLETVTGEPVSLVVRGVVPGA